MSATEPNRRDVVLPLLEDEWRLVEEAAAIEQVRPLEVWVWQVLTRRARRVLKRRDRTRDRIRAAREARRQ